MTSAVWDWMHAESLKCCCGDHGRAGEAARCCKQHGTAAAIENRRRGLAESDEREGGRPAAPPKNDRIAIRYVREFDITPDSKPFRMDDYTVPEVVEDHDLHRLADDGGPCHDEADR